MDKCQLDKYCMANVTLTVVASYELSVVLDNNLVNINVQQNNKQARTSMDLTHVRANRHYLRFLQILIFLSNRM